MTYFVGISGGKDSMAALLWAIHESGTDRRDIIAGFCDTGNEHPTTYKYVGWVSRNVHPVVTLLPDRDFYQLAAHKKRFPSAKARFCTEELKMVPTRNYLHWLQESGRDVVSVTGVRGSESVDRAQLKPRDWDEYLDCETFRPLLSWSVEDVWAFLEKHGVPRNPLYDQGRLRVGCDLCVMSKKADVRVVSRHSPAAIDRIAEAEPVIGSTFFHRTHVPLRYRSHIITSNGKPGGEEKAGGLFRGDVIELLPIEPRQMAVPTIQDVARWACDEREESGVLDLNVEMPPTCPSMQGYCE